MASLNRLYCSGRATEHSYRPALQECLSNLLKNVDVTNEPKRQQCGAPDYILMRQGIPVGYIEAKDIGVDLDKTEKDEQLIRYKASLNNLVLTDYVDFRFFVNGQRVDQVSLGSIGLKGLVPDQKGFEKLKTLLTDFSAFQGQTIKSARELAEMMAHKSALMRDVFLNTLNDVTGNNTTLSDQLKAFRGVLMHDMTKEQFADVYAQTIAYGLFTARLHQNNIRTFSRAEALTLIPRSNPFLRQLFHYVAGPDLDERVVWIVDALCEVYSASDLRLILKDFGSSTGRNDPILHFYETFLAEYDPKLRKARGVWYTPEPVVHFIIKSIDEVLKTHFGLREGLAHTGMVEIDIESGSDKKGKTIFSKRSVHKLQLLDVAAGTGTFLAEVVKQIFSRFKEQKGMWPGYVEQHLLPRLHGFELLMASYAMCHMKLDLLLKDTGYVPSNIVNPPRLGVYLTNSLEEHHPDTGTLFAQCLAREANEASRIKKETPIMVAFGNPPYSGVSSNMESWIAKKKIADYKSVDGKPINERKHWLNDDYVQFIRLGESYIERNGEGVLAYITNHGYLDNVTFRGMRWHLLSTFDFIYVLDLHGSSLRDEDAPDGSDENVFDIKPGVAIIIAVKTLSSTKKKEIAKVYHGQLWGTRAYKYDFLTDNSLKTAGLAELSVMSPGYLFVPQDLSGFEDYLKGFKLNEFMAVNSTGVQTSRDHLVVGFTRKELESKLSNFVDPAQTDNDIRTKLFAGKGSKKYPDGDTRGWKVGAARKLLATTEYRSRIKHLHYRPFDIRFYIDDDIMIDWPRRAVMSNLGDENVALLLPKQLSSSEYHHVFCSRLPCEMCVISSSTKEQNYVFPLWVKDPLLEKSKLGRPNFDKKILDRIKKNVGDVRPEDVFDYIYAILNSPTYRTRYFELLKQEFPRIPFPTDAFSFHKLAKLGRKMRLIHLMESELSDDLITTFPITGDNSLDSARWEDDKNDPNVGKIWINASQYFGKVPEVAWNFQIGGYQPAQKWLKDRRSRKLSSDDLIQWQKIIVALDQTSAIMEDIDALI